MDGVNICFFQIVSVPEPEFPPPPPPAVSLPSAPPLYPSNGFSGSPPGLSQQQSFDDWDDDEWDDDDGESSNSTTGTAQVNLFTSSTIYDSSYYNFIITISQTIMYTDSGKQKLDLNWYP